MVPRPDVTLVVNGRVVREGLVKFAVTVTGLLGMVKMHGLLADPLEHEAPVVVHTENAQPGEGVAVTLTCEPTCSW
jgi:hypothetical protein